MIQLTFTNAPSYQTGIENSLCFVYFVEIRHSPREQGRTTPVLRIESSSRSSSHAPIYGDKEKQFKGKSSEHVIFALHELFL